MASMFDIGAGMVVVGLGMMVTAHYDLQLFTAHAVFRLDRMRHYMSSMAGGYVVTAVSDAEEEEPEQVASAPVKEEEDDKGGCKTPERSSSSSDFVSADFSS